MPMLGSEDPDGKIEELRLHVMDAIHGVHQQLMDQTLRLDVLEHRAERSDRVLAGHEEKFGNHEVEMANAIVNIRETFLQVDRGMGEAKQAAENIDNGMAPTTKGIAPRPVQP